MQSVQCIREAMIEAIHQVLTDQSKVLSSCNELKHLVFIKALPEASKPTVSYFEVIYNELVQEPEIDALIIKHLFER